ncbi:MAG: DNA polymerase III subunit chi [Hydrogenophaga sp.]|jgi:DNA polymerase-3 subunit chi|nr:DNA polymerase III subunit chi [Hydrogenophaga sp.]
MSGPGGSLAQVAFHINASDKIEYTCRLLRKAYLKGSRCQVLASQDDLQALDAALWVRAAGEFLAHSTDGDALAVRERSLLHLGRLAPSGLRVLVILGDDEPPLDMGDVERVIEVVSTQEADKARARLRWKAYRLRGIEPVRHDLAST